MDLEEVWRIREEEIYPSLFGAASRGIFTLSIDQFREQFKQKHIDPRWLFYGVFEFAPTEKRQSWLYVSSGHSNPWEQEPSEFSKQNESGMGVEFTIATKRQADWPIRILKHIVAFDLLLCAGRYEGKPPLQMDDRLPLRAPLNGREDCKLTSVAVTPPEGIDRSFMLPSGKVELFSLAALTDSEMEFAKQHGTPSTIDRLRNENCHPVIDETRNSIF